MATVAGLLSACSPRVDIVSTLPAIRFITTDGSALGPEQYRGKPVLINFWSTTCAVCLREMPLLQALHEEHAQKGLVVIAAAMPYDRPSDVLELRALKKWGFHVTIDPQGKTVGQFGQIKAVPVTVLFEPDGRRVWFHQGELKDAEIRKALDSVLEKKSS